MQVGFKEALLVARADLFVPLCQQRTVQRELLRIRRVGGHQGIKVLGVVGVELRLDDSERGSRFHQFISRENSAYSSTMLSRWTSSGPST
ncbi:hypothetical protein MasN3_13570 [Massilia varians]|uniref:Uncharacterized protein n=1 Tax=Massilia varians TaxID=457921 RepID=A0ABM8C3V7_9BURK|nr:hypothetical protein MasN3_13570 [Massilia varians]